MKREKKKLYLGVFDEIWTVWMQTRLENSMLVLTAGSSKFALGLPIFIFDTRDSYFTAMRENFFGSEALDFLLFDSFPSHLNGINKVWENSMLAVCKEYPQSRLKIDSLLFFRYIPISLFFLWGTRIYLTTCRATSRKR